MGWGDHEEECYDLVSCQVKQESEICAGKGKLWAQACEELASLGWKDDERNGLVVQRCDGAKNGGQLNLAAC